MFTPLVCIFAYIRIRSETSYSTRHPIPGSLDHLPLVTWLPCQGSAAGRSVTGKQTPSPESLVRFTVLSSTCQNEKIEIG